MAWRRVRVPKRARSLLRRNSEPELHLPPIKMKLRYAAALRFALLVSYTPSATAMNCEQEDSLPDVSGSGAILEMLSGQIYKVDDSDQVDSSLWLATDDVLICSQTFTVKGKTLHCTRSLTKTKRAKKSIQRGCGSEARTTIGPCVHPQRFRVSSTKEPVNQLYDSNRNDVARCSLGYCANRA